MSLETLQQFARQIEAWSAEELQNRPGPFRSVEALPSLIGGASSPLPAIVFWINRESHLAGGVILLPKKDPDTILESGEEFCDALGLDCYYTWGIGEVAAWQVSSPSGRLWSEPLPETTLQEAHAFRETLSLLLLNMQNRFFGHQQHLPQLSSPYLANLLHNCIESALPATAAAVTEVKADQDKNAEAGRQNLASVVLQMLSLQSQNLLLGRTSPECLLNDLKQATEQLPAPLVTALHHRIDSTRLPEQALIKLHHLYQRLQQLGPQLTPFIPEAVHQLICFWAKATMLSPLPAPLKKNKETLILNPDRYHPDMSVRIEIARPPLTAATALLRLLQSNNRRHPAQYTDPLDLQTPVDCVAIIGTLNDRSRTTADKQKQLNAQLRFSWPNRHLKLHSTSPRWAWQLIHLVGLFQNRPRGTLALPADWLWAPYGEQVYTLLSERCTLSNISHINSNTVLTELNQPTDKQQLTIHAFNGEIRRLNNQDGSLSRSEILLALSLSSPVFDLVRNGELKAVSETQEVDAAELFLNSSLGRGLWKILSPKKSPPKRENLSREIIRTGLPLPGAEAMTALTGLAQKNARPDTPTIDRELEVWLGAACLTGEAARFKTTSITSSKPRTENRAKEKAVDLIRKGDVPIFPKDYLYGIAENDRRTFSISAPLRQVESFFNSVTLAPTKGDALIVDGQAKAKALQIISTFQIGEFELPENEHQVSDLLDRYLLDLQKLYTRMCQDSADPGQVMTPELVEQIWNHLPVPPRNILDND